MTNKNSKVDVTGVLGLIGALGALGALGAMAIELPTGKELPEVHFIKIPLGGIPKPEKQPKLFTETQSKIIASLIEAGMDERNIVQVQKAFVDKNESENKELEDHIEVISPTFPVEFEVIGEDLEEEQLLEDEQMQTLVDAVSCIELDKDQQYALMHTGDTVVIKMLKSDGSVCMVVAESPYMYNGTLEDIKGTTAVPLQKYYELNNRAQLSAVTNEPVTENEATTDALASGKLEVKTGHACSGCGKCSKQKQNHPF